MGNFLLKGTETKSFFIVHEHHAKMLHFDFRLAMDGVLKSWAMPKGPSMNPKEKRLAIMVVDHPLEYGSFEGVIPEGMYGAGTVIIWDKGRFKIKEGTLEMGRLTLILYGEKLKGVFSLIKMSGKNKGWLFIKKADEYADYTFKLKTVLKKT